MLNFTIDIPNVGLRTFSAPWLFLPTYTALGLADVTAECGYDAEPAPTSAVDSVAMADAIRQRGAFEVVSAGLAFSRTDSS